MVQMPGNFTGMICEKKHNIFPNCKEEVVNKWFDRLWMAKKKDIAILNNHINARNYQKVLNDHMLPVSEETGRTRFTFQQDHAPIHTTNFIFK